jgi:predicted transcriptional regulator
LTQIGYVEPVQPENFDMELTPEKRPQKRRRTMGDTPSSSFHTQTITQMIPRAGHDGDEDVEHFSDLEDEEEDDENEDSKTSRKMEGQVPNKALSHVTDSRATSMVPQTPVHKKAKKDVYEVPSSQPTPGTPIATTPFDTERFRIPPLRSPLQERTPNINPSLPRSPTLETTTRRPRSMVVEDSYSSAPGLPSSDPIRSPFKVPRLPYIKEAASARASMELGELVPGRLPASSIHAVGEGSATNTRRPLGEIELEIPDSDDELLSLGPTPVKSVTDAVPPSTPSNVASLRSRLLVQTTPKLSSEEDDREIESSDAELDPGSPTPVARKVHSSNPRPNSQKAGQRGNAPSSATVHGPSEHTTAITPTPLSRTVQVQGLETREDDLLAATPLTSQKSAPKSAASRNTGSRTVEVEPTAKTQEKELEDEMVTATPLASQRSAGKSPPSHNTRSRKVQVQIPEETQDEDVTQDTPAAKSQYYTQGVESQRVPLEAIRAMAPQTDRSDIIISIHPEPADLIANGRKSHEFRNYKILSTVSRIWIYVTSPICELRYMAIIGPAKQPGEIDDNSGTGNREFNAGTGSKYAHELLQVYQLNNPVSLAKMKENGWVQGPPQKYTFIPPAVVGQLLGNLQRELFPEGPQSNLEESQGMLSTPQQIEDQLRSDIIHSTQLAPEGAMDNAIVLSSQGEPSQGQRTPAEKRTSDEVFARPQLPASKTPTSAQRLPTLPQLPSLSSLPPNRDANAVRPSQATTASEASSPGVSPEKSLPRPVLLTSSGPSFPDYLDDESPVRFVPGQHYSLASSQLRLPESLMVDDVRQPPDIRDSDEEEDDD